MRKTTLLALLLALAALPILAEERYQVPPPELASLVDAPPTPSMIVGPADYALLAEAPLFLTIADLAQPELKIAGLRFNPKNHEQTRFPYFRDLRVLQLSKGGARQKSGVTRRREPVVDCRADLAALHRRLARPMVTGDQQDDPVTAHDRRAVREVGMVSTRKPLRHGASLPVVWVPQWGVHATSWPNGGATPHGHGEARLGGLPGRAMRAYVGGGSSRA